MSPIRPEAREVQRCDVCIVGAGYAGLNALVVASHYLSADQRVVLVDRHDRAGGMWVDTYAYVRLHQPHRMFTAADVRWQLDADPAHLATRSEVLDQMQHCLDEARARVIVEERFGWELVSEEEVEDRVLVRCTDRDGRTVVLETDRLIKAYGHDVAPNPPLELSSTQVASVSPDQDDRMREVFDDHSPVWIVGGGKTGMDTAFALLRRDPDRVVNLVAGSGTWQRPGPTQGHGPASRALLAGGGARRSEQVRQVGCCDGELSGGVGVEGRCGVRALDPGLSGAELVAGEVLPDDLVVEGLRALGQHRVEGIELGAQGLLTRLQPGARDRPRGLTDRW